MSATPVFSQQVDVLRPHTLLTANPARSGSLEYRYEDTHETVSVPNIWYNQTFQSRVSAIRWQAKLLEEQGDKFEKSPPYDLSPLAAADIARRYRERAARIHAEADRIAAAGDSTKPVAASRLSLDFGANVML